MAIMKKSKIDTLRENTCILSNMNLNVIYVLLVIIILDVAANNDILKPNKPRHEIITTRTVAKKMKIPTQYTKFNQSLQNSTMTKHDKGIKLNKNFVKCTEAEHSKNYINKTVYQIQQIDNMQENFTFFTPCGIYYAFKEKEANNFVITLSVVFFIIASILVPIGLVYWHRYLEKKHITTQQNVIHDIYDITRV